MNTPPETTAKACPHCGAPVTMMSNGKPCRAYNGDWVAFDCLTSIHAGQHPRMSQSRKCEEAERERLAMEVATLRTANAGLVEKVKRLEEAGDVLAMRHTLVPTTYPTAQANVAEWTKAKGQP